jgi:hypothetical protein
VTHQSEVRALLQDELPIEPGGRITQHLSHAVGGPLPDKIEVVAGVWADGETFGQPDWVKVILKNREIQASAYEQATSMLQRGLDQNWTRDQYLQARKLCLNPSGHRHSGFENCPFRHSSG